VCRYLASFYEQDYFELHDLISSLPMFLYLTAEVTALAVHPLNRGS
jgi:muconolactone delta-isomerase